MRNDTISKEEAQAALKIIDVPSLAKVTKDELIKRAYHVGLFLVASFLVSLVKYHDEE